MTTDFTENELTEIRSGLEARYESLKMREKADENLETSLAGADEATSTLFHQADEGSIVAEQETFAELVSMEIRELQNIEDALIRIDKGRYGVCEECGEPIGRLRLERIPEARFCSDCATDYERRVKASRHASTLDRGDLDFR